MLDTIFITDLHGNLSALKKAVLKGNKIGKVRYLIIGGDIAPNLVTIKFSDNKEYVLRHSARFSTNITKDFTLAIKKNKLYSLNNTHGKLPIKYRLPVSSRQFFEMAFDKKNKILRYPASFRHLQTAQIEYLKKDLLPTLEEYKRKGIEVFIMLGNDDFVELENLLLSAEKKGLLKYINQQVCRLGQKKILGYSYVRSKPFRYRFWEKTEKNIYLDLKKILKNQKTSELILSLHSPPFGTNLDIMFYHKHIGSKAVRKILLENRFAIALFGHIHESPLLSGRVDDSLGGNLIINPGGFHNSKLGAILFDSNNCGKWVSLGK